jgi:hypothetical protein
LKGSSPADKIAAENRRNAQKSMRDVAKMTGGQYFAAPDSQKLFAALNKLGGDLDYLQREKMDSFRYRRYREGYAWFAGAAFVLWFAVLSLECTRWRRFP